MAGLLSSCHACCCLLNTSSWVSYRHLTLNTYKTQLLISFLKLQISPSSVECCQHTSISIGQILLATSVLPSNPKYDLVPQPLAPKWSSEPSISPHTYVPGLKAESVDGPSPSCIAFAYNPFTLS